VKRHIGLVFIACAALAAGTVPAASAATGAAADSGPYTVTDTLGRSLTFDNVPEHIVLAGRATLLLVDAVYLFPGAGSRVIGVGATDQGLGDFFPYLDPQAKSKKRLPNTVGPEEVAALRPDLVILKSYMKASLGDPLSAIGVRVLYLDLETPDRFYADVRTLGALFQQPERADHILDWYHGRIDAVTRAVAGAGRPSALIAQYNLRDGSFTVPPTGWIQSTMTELAGATVAWKEAGPGDGWKKVGMEQLSAWNPGWVFVVSYQAPASAAATRIVKDGLLKGNVLGFPADFYSWDQADSRWILGLEWLAVTLHPDALHSLDMRAEVRSFYGDLYGVDAATVDAVVLPRLGNLGTGK
jgi:iron complex transport system substrate-binding protein